MNLISVTQAAERYEKSTDALTSCASMYKAKNGKFPKWYVVCNKRVGVRIDIDEYERLGILERKLWMFATDKLFWAFEDLGFNQWQTAKLLSENSTRFKTVYSWNTFFQNSLFSIPPMIISEGEKSMRAEFVQVGTRIIYDMIKKGEIDVASQRDL